MNPIRRQRAGRRARNLLVFFCLGLALVSCGNAGRQDPIAGVINKHEHGLGQDDALSEAPLFPARPGGMPRRSAHLLNFGSDAQPWLAKLRRLGRDRYLSSGRPTVFRVLLMGDSHTAGGHFGDAVRRRLQARLGDAGIGWVQPAQIKGQRISIMSYAGHWKAATSRTDAGDFTLGGVISWGDGGDLTLIPQTGGAMLLKLIARPDDPMGEPLIVSDSRGRSQTPLGRTRPGWQLLTLDRVQPPITLSDPQRNWTLGAVGLENGRPGLTFSAMGINGAQITEIGKWHRSWAKDLAYTEADLVILEYGTNEVYKRKEVEWGVLERQWRRVLSQIHAALPQAGVMIVAAPEALQSTAGECGHPSPYLAQMQRLQERIARSQGALYWPWQAAMGGECSMKQWMNQGLAARDGVHFDKAGYHQLGVQLADAILGLAR